MNDVGTVSAIRQRNAGVRITTPAPGISVTVGVTLGMSPGMVTGTGLPGIASAGRRRAVAR